jgi:vacuolar-type H+-ATPase subunit I/STV1
MGSLQPRARTALQRSDQGQRDGQPPALKYGLMARLSRFLFGNLLLRKRIDAATDVVQAEDSFGRALINHQRTMGELADIEVTVAADSNERWKRYYESEAELEKYEPQVLDEGTPVELAEEINHLRDQEADELQKVKSRPAKTKEERERKQRDMDRVANFYESEIAKLQRRRYK